MKINRIIYGEEVEIELTGMEVYNAYHQYKRECLIEDIRAEMMERDEEINPEDYNLEQMVDFVQNGIDGNDSFWDNYWDAIRYAIDDCLDDFKVNKDEN